ncbi:MAG TPA: hypothetical protein VF627_06190 [Abditibacterium sp.]|jgi:hypothetical protein
MKPILLLLFGFSLTASTLAPSVTAQNAAQTAPKTGYETLVAAGKLILPGENGLPWTRETLTPEENLRRQRLAVARNAPALKMLREALKMPVEMPIPFQADEANLKSFNSLREMARQLRQESEVRLADGDIAGALDSRLTGIELGAAITRGAPSNGVLMGIAIESIARQNFEVVAAKLDAPQIRAVLIRLKQSDARRATPAQTWQVEAATMVPLITAQFQSLFDPKVRKFLATPAGRAEAELTEAQAQDMLALTPEKLAAQVSQVFDGFIARDGLPYQQAVKTKLPTPPSQYVASFIPSWDSAANSSFSYARNLSAQRLFEAALELRHQTRNRRLSAHFSSAE